MKQCVLITPPPLSLGPPGAPIGLLLLSLSAYEAKLMWKTPFDGHDPITMYFVHVWTDDRNVSNNFCILELYTRAVNRNQLTDNQTVIFKISVISDFST